MNEKILVFGGLGDPNHSIISLYAPLFKELSKDYEIVAIDILNLDRDKMVKIIEEQLGLKYDKIMTPKKAFEDLKRKNFGDIKAVFILTPVSSHLEILEEFTKIEKKGNTLFIVEKPSFSIDEFEKGFEEIAGNLKRKKNSFYFIDTAMIAPSINKIIEENYLKNIGRIQKIIAVAVDNPITRSEKLSNYTFKNKVDALNKRGLLDLNKSGGAGYGFDMGIHAAAGLMRLLESINIDSIKINDVRLEVLSEEKIIRDKGAETYALIKGETIGYNYPGIEVIVEGGKGSHIWDRRLEVYGEGETLIIGLGTLAHKPYIRCLKKKTDQIFNLSDTSYSLHFQDILKILEEDKDTILSPEINEKIMKNSIKFMKEAYYSIDADTKQREDK